MTYRTHLHSALACAAMSFFSLTAHAGLFRAYLSAAGNDANACTLLAPCRLLPAALAAISDGGEIWMLNSANYNTGTVNIAKSATLLAVPGAVGSVLAINGPAINIAPGFSVALRNLVIVPQPGGGGTDGIDLQSGSVLTIENSLIANLPGHGVSVNGTAKLEISDSIIRDNALYAVHLQDGATADIIGTKMLNNYSGGVRAYTFAATTTTATLGNSVVSGGNEGVYAYANNTGGAANIFVTRSTIQNTSYALDSETGAGSSLIAVSYSMIANNNYGWYQYQAGSGSSIYSLGNNNFSANTSSFGSLTEIALK